MIEDELPAQSQLTRLLFQHARAGLMVNIGVVLVLAALFRDEVPGAALASWTVALLAVTGWRLALVARFDRVSPPDTELGAWRRQFLIGAAGTGVLLGISWWVIAPHTDFEGHVVLSFVLAGMALGAAQVLGSAYHVYVVYVLSLLGPGILYLFSHDTRTYATLGSLGVIFLLAMLATGRGQYRTLSRMMSLSAANRSLREHQVRLRDFADLGADLFWECDPQGRYRYISEGYERLTGVAPKRLVGEPIDAPGAPCFVPDDRIGESADLERPIVDHTLVWSLPDGDNVVLLSNALPVHDPEGRFTGLRGTVRDITEQHRLAERLRHQATHDALTGLVNRAEFEQRLERMLATSRSGGAVHCACFLDLDQFKVVNDTCGHAAGDALLRQIATELSTRLRARDTLARLGGDEFGLLLEHCELEHGLRIARGVCEAIGDMRFDWHGRQFRVSASIGLVPVDASSQDLATVLRRADAACYGAKEAGRNRVQVYEAEHADFTRRHGEMQWVTRITRALDEGRLRLAAQPIVPAAAAGGTGGRHLELLVRMVDDDGGLILPEAFLGAAERYHVATRLDRWVVDTALDWLASDPARLAGVGTCAINLSTQSLTDEALLAHLEARLENGPVTGRQLCFEITETAAVRDIGSSVACMERLRSHGCRFALDDFGTGAASFAYLRSLPVDFVKIDGSFVQGMLDDEVDLAMVTAIRDVAHLMGRQTVAECVESEAAFAKLRQLGVDYAQGTALGRPELV